MQSVVWRGVDCVFGDATILSTVVGGARPAIRRWSICDTIGNRAVISGHRKLTIGLTVVIPSLLSTVVMASDTVSPRDLSMRWSDAPTSVATSYRQSEDEVALTDSGDTESDPWTFELILYPYLMPARIDGRSTVAGVSVPISFHLKEVINDLSFSAAVRFEAWKGPWGLTVDAMYTKIEGDPLSIGPITPDVEIVQAAVEFGLSYRFLETDMVSTSEEESAFGYPLTCELMGGVRYAYLKQRLKIGPLPRLGRSEDWVEPWIGMRFRLGLSDRLRLESRFDFGGFGVGSASKLTWNAIVGMDYRIKENMSLKLGYRIYDIEYSNGSGFNKFGLDMKMHGPTIGIAFKF